MIIIYIFTLVYIYAYITIVIAMLVYPRKFIFNLRINEIFLLISFLIYAMLIIGVCIRMDTTYVIILILIYVIQIIFRELINF